MDMLSGQPQAATRNGWRRLTRVGVGSQRCLSRRVGIHRTGRPRSDDFGRCADPGYASGDRTVKRNIVANSMSLRRLMSIPRTPCLPLAVWLGDQVNGRLVNAPSR